MINNQNFIKDKDMYYNNRRGTPLHIPLGVNDLSGRRVPYEIVGNPQHLPLFFLRTSRGSAGFQHLSPSNVVRFYGLETFKPNSKYDLMDVTFAKTIIGEGNSVCVVRTNVDDSLKAGFILYARVTTLEVSENGKDYTKALVSWFTLPYSDDPTFEESNDAALATIETNSAFTKFYKILKMQTLSNSEDYLGMGLSFEAFTGITRNAKVNDAGHLTYAVRLHETFDGIIDVKETVVGGRYQEAGFADDVVDPVTGTSISLDTILPEKWENFEDYGTYYEPKELEDAIVYKDNAKALAEELMNVEKAARQVLIGAEYDADHGVITGPFAMNFFDNKDMYGKPYMAIEQVAYANGIPTAPYMKNVVVGPNTPVMFRNKKVEDADGEYVEDLSQETHEAFIRNYMVDYQDENSFLIDMASNPETFIYDCQYTMETKTHLAKFISVRKNTHLIYTTMVPEDNDRGLEVPVDTHLTRQAYLMSVLRLMPDSEYYNTPVIRGAVCMGDAKILNDVNSKRYYPQSLELAQKMARMMGAGDGAMKRDKLFASHPGNLMELMHSPRPAKLNLAAKESAWVRGLIVTQVFDRKQYFTPAYQTVYYDDTSVDNNIFASTAICTLTTYNDIIWRKFTGNVDLTNAELADAIETEFMKMVSGKFADLFNISAKVIITERDKIKGNTWHMEVTLRGGIMKTQMVSTIVTRRREGEG